MDEELQGTELWNNVDLRRSVLTDALPNMLLREVGLAKILERVSLTLKLSDEIEMFLTPVYRFPKATYEPSLAASSPLASSTRWVSPPRP